MSWVALLTLMVDGPDPSVRGVVRSIEGDDRSRRFFAFGAGSGSPRAVFPGMGPGLVRQVWRDGAGICIRDEQGRPLFIGNEDTVWQFDSAHDVPLAKPADVRHFWVGGVILLHRRSAPEWLGPDFTRPTSPIGQTEFLGRPAYTVELAPPPHKPYPMQLVVDAETGNVLQQRNDGFGSVDEWTELVVGEELEDALFSWEGPARPWEDEQAERRVEYEREQDACRAWFVGHIGPLPLRVELALDVTVHTHDDDGSFEGSLAGPGHLGSLARRPRSGTDWPLTWDEVTCRWTDELWDWALRLDNGVTLSADALADLQHQLGSRPG